MSQLRTAQARMEDFFYHELLRYLRLAEEKRRWNVFNDIPWEAANPNTSDTMAQCVETFCTVEMYLPDFTAKLLSMIRQSRGRSWFHINWGYEESKHSLALEGWLLASGHRTEEQREEAEKALHGAEWELPFDHPRQMVCYTMVQELATFWNYRNLEKMAAHEGDRCLVTALRLISVDERVHYNFFKNTVKQWMKWDERGTVEDLKYVFDNFTMPGSTQIPQYEDSARLLAKTGIYGPREYIKLVKKPILQDMKLDKDFNKLEAEEAKEKARKEARAAQEASVEKIHVGNGHAVPKGTGPLNSHALSQVLENTGPNADHARLHGVARYPDGRKRSPFLDMVGVDQPKREPGRSLILTVDEAGKLGGSRGMENLDNDLDQRLLAIGDELSNDAEELRKEREEIRKQRDAARVQRVKNDKLFKKGKESSEG